MPEIAGPPDPPCSSLFFESGIEVSQALGPDRFSPRARDARARFVKGRSGNPRGRPRGIPNPKRRLPDLIARPLSPEALSAFLDRKPHLLRPLAALYLPPPIAASDPAEVLGIDLSSVCTREDAEPVLRTVLAATSRGEIAPSDALRIARRVRTRLRAIRRLGRTQRRLARAMASRRGRQPKPAICAQSL